MRLESARVGPQQEACKMYAQSGHGAGLIACVAVPCCVHACLEITFSKLLKSEVLWIPGDFDIKSLQ